MSCYLNVYLVKKDKVEGDKPLFFTQYSKDTEIYSSITESMYVPFLKDDENVEYADLTREVVQEALHNIESKKSKIKKRLETLYRIIKENYNEDIKNEIIDSEDYLTTLQEESTLIDNIKFLVDTCNPIWSDFEKVVVNQG